MSLKKFVIGGAFAILLAAPLQAQAERSELAEKLGARPSIIDISLSPSGKSIAVVAPAGTAREVVYTVDLVAGGAPRPILQFAQEEGDLRSCEWASEERLLCTTRFSQDRNGYYIAYTRMFSINSDGTDAVALIDPSSSRSFALVQGGGHVLALDIDGESDKILVVSPKGEGFTTATRFGNDESGLAVEQLDIRNNRWKTVEKARVNAEWYAADEHGRVRLMDARRSNQRGYLVGEARHMYRKLDSDEWFLLELNSAELADFEPVAVESARDMAYGYATKNGFKGLFGVKLDGSGAVEELLWHNGVDVSNLRRIGRQRRVVGVDYVGERRKTEFFDEELKSLSTALRNALPGKPAVSIIDASADEKRLLLIASSDIDPGMVYLFDKASAKLEPLLPLRQQVEGMAFAQMRSVRYPAADGTMIPAYLTMPPNAAGKKVPGIVMPHGGPSSRDEWGFDWLVQYFALKGYAVLQPNYRGSSGYGNAWYQENGFKSWKTAIGDVGDAGKWLVSEGIVDPGKLAIVGWSYGGYAALQSGITEPDLFKSVVAIAPVTDLDELKKERLNFVGGRYSEEFIGDGPHIQEGSPARQAERMGPPVLMFHGVEDENVGVRQSRLMESQLKKAGKSAEYHEFEGLDHYLDDSDIRAMMLDRTHSFLQQSFAD